MTQFKRAVRQSSMTLADHTFESIITSYVQAINGEYEYQQEKIDKAHRSFGNICLGIDTSFSQNRNAQYSQTAGLEHDSGELIRMVIMDREQEQCAATKLDALGVGKLIQSCHSANLILSIISTDDSSEFRSLLFKKSQEQQLEFDQEIIIQNDAFHKLKNSRKVRATKFRDSKINSQKLSAKLEDLKICGMQQIALQFGMVIHQEDRITKQQYIDMLDPKIK